MPSMRLRSSILSVNESPIQEVFRLHVGSTRRRGGHPASCKNNFGDGCIMGAGGASKAGAPNE